MTQPLLVFGANGQLGRALRLLWPQAICLDRKDADFTHPDALEDVLERYAPACVINASAYTQVDNAEAEYDIVYRINAESPAAIAIYCAEHDIPFVHFSTDYVFDGTGERPWKEDDRVGPLGAYGRSKLEGEDKIQQIGKQFLIFRTSWLYDASGKNFLNTMLRLGAEREELKVVNDQIGAPTYVAHLARAVFHALQAAQEMDAFPSGIYNLCNAGAVSWHGFALAIFEEARAREASLKINRVLPISSEEYPTLAKRPKNSRLNMGKAERVFGIRMPDWREGLKECMKERFPA